MKLIEFFNRKESETTVRGWINFYHSSWDKNAYINWGIVIVLPITKMQPRFDLPEQIPAVHNRAYGIYFRIRKPMNMYKNPPERMYWKRIIFNFNRFWTYIK